MLIWAWNAFGKLTQLERRVIISRLNLPTPDNDKANKFQRYRQINTVTRDTGLSATYISNPTRRMISRL